MCGCGKVEKITMTAVGTQKNSSKLGKHKRSHLVGPPFPEFKAHFSAMAGWHFLREAFANIIGGCGQSHVSGKDG